MPCAIILRDALYDIVIETDNADRVEKLYNIARQLDCADQDEEEAPLNKQLLATTGELWINSKAGIFNDELTFREKFPGRRVPMRLTIRQAEKIKWYHGIVYEGLAYFQKLALSEDKTLAPMSEFPPSIFLRPRRSSIVIPAEFTGLAEEFREKAIMDHYMFIVELRLERNKAL
jgi:hypothetical protein